MKFLRVRTTLLALLVVSGVSAAPMTYPQGTLTWGPQIESSQATELVYAGSGSTTKFSELDWPALALGASVTAGVDWSRWLFTTVEIVGMAPLGTGTLTDDDWNIYDDSGNLLTKVHSDSTAYLTSRWSFRSEAGVPFHWGPVTAHLLGGFLYEQRAWEAWNPKQSQTYAATGTTTSQSLTGLGIQFRQEWWIPYVGGTISAPFQGATVAAGMRASPLGRASQSDSHVLRQLQFNETLTGGWYLEPSVSVTWALFPGWNTVLDARYLALFGFRGDETVSQDGAAASSSSPFVSYSDAAGGELRSIQVRLFLQTTWGGSAP